MVIERIHSSLPAKSRSFSSSQTNVEVGKFYSQRSNAYKSVIVVMSASSYSQDFSVVIREHYKVLDENGNYVEVSKDNAAQNYTVPAGSSMTVVFDVQSPTVDAVSVIVSFTRNASGGSGSVTVYYKEAS